MEKVEQPISTSDRPTLQVEATEKDLSLYTQSVLTLAKGTVLLKRYELERTLGKGGMGVVWLAHDLELKEKIALKFLPEVVSRDKASFEELKLEVRRSRRLKHHNIVSVHDYLTDEDWAAISMEYVDGENLSDIRVRQPGQVFDAAKLRPLIEQLCAALDYAHTRAKMVHHDLKPANCLVTPKGELKVCDFGIARSLSESVTRLTTKERTSGTLPYMSPQQLMGEDPSALDDIYSLGAMLYNLLTSKPPFYSGNIASQVMEKLAPPMMQRRQSLGIQAAPIPEEWEAVVAACLSKDASQRPQSACEAAERLAPKSMAIAVAAPSPGAVPSADASTVVDVASPVIPAHTPSSDKVEASEAPTLASSEAPTLASATASSLAGAPGPLAASPAEAVRALPETGKAVRTDQPRPRHAVKTILWVGAVLLMISAAGSGWYWRVYLPVENARLIKIAEFEKEKRQKKLEAKAADNAADKARLEAEARKAEEEIALLQTEREKKKQAQLEREQQALTLALPVALAFKNDGKWSDVVAALENPLKAPGAIDHPNREAAEALLRQAQTEIKNRADFVDILKKADGLLAAGQFSSARASYEEAKKLWPQSPDVSKVDAGIEASSKGEKSQKQGALFAESLKNADQLLAASRFPEARAAYEEAKKLWPESPDIAKVTAGLQACAKAEKARKISDLLAKAKANDDPHSGLGAGKEHIKIAMSALDELLTLEPTNEEAKKLREKIAEYSPVPRKGKPFTNSLGMKFAPVGDVLFSVWETRVQDFEAFVQATGHNAEDAMNSLGVDGWKQRSHTWREPGFSQTPTHPVVGVSWEDAMAFCKWLTEKERKDGMLPAHQRYRLPTDTEWTRAAGAGKYPWGDAWPPPEGAGNFAGAEAKDKLWPEDLEPMAQYRDGFVRTSPVGSFKANAFGLFDLGGNAWEWCMDWYRKELNSIELRKQSPILNEDQGGQTYRVMRGGSWFNENSDNSLFSAYRGFVPPGLRYSSRGFRCVLAND
ncbi:MAG: SUMF1/EgtB/PvdO family nonheme iron enzyme [Verrucomicrobia bacterium]|nr:SUMF1/EgtB/PvdO family nonheme iron enzyme [Verrucomicrobiota bacterium]